MAQLCLPESVYEPDSNMNYQKLIAFYESNITITGNVLRLNSSAQLLEVELGNGFMGVMSFEDSTIYPIFKEDGTPSPNLYQLVGKNINVKIINMEDGNIFLSRRKNMLEALEFLKNEKEIRFATVTAFSKLSAFFDIGAGIIGRAYSKDFSNVKYKNIKDIGVEVGEMLPVNIISFFEEENKFNLSRVNALPSSEDFYSEGDVVTAKVFDRVTEDEDEIGYYVLIDKRFCGIVDSSNIKLEYGDTISVFIKHIKENGLLKLTMVKKL